MNESNFEQFFNSRPHESSTRSEMNFYDFENTSASTLGSASAHYQCNPYRTTIPKDNGICECMNNCHLTDSWMPYLKQENNFNCNTQLSNNIPILNSYAPTRQLIELQTTANVSPYPSIFYNNVDYTTRSIRVNPTSSFKARDQNYFQQHDFLQEDISRYGKLNYDTTSYHHYYNQPQINSQNSLMPNGTIKYEERTKTSIKFQDRNKKLDFKTSFREENCKVNGCFHHEETSSSVELTSDVFATPKKKWIRNYITEETKPKLESSPSPSLVVISRPPAHFTPQQVTIDLSKNSTIPSTLSNGSGNSVTIYNIDESPTSLNLSTESSGYVSNSTTSSLGNLSLNQSGVNGEDVESEKSSPLLDQKLSTPIQSTFSALPMPPSVSSGRRRTISSNSNSSTLRSPSTVRAGTREVHNKLEKNRRAHLKECFEALKKQLPITPDEKKTSNLSILGAAIRHIQFVKRKEREYEHEMERLAKEKISNQNRIIFLKRELTQRDIDFTKLLPEQTDVTAVKSERNETSNDGKNGVLYNTSSSLPNTARTSPVASLTNSTNLSSNLMGTSSMPGSPSRITMLSTGNQIMPLSLTSKSTNDENLSSKLSINPIKLPTTNIQTKPTLMPIATPGSGSQMPTALNLKAGEIPSSCQTMPLNLHAAVSSVTNIHPLNGLKNGLKGYNNSKESKTNKSSSPVITSMSMSSNCMTQPQVTSTTSNMKIDQHEPPKKLIKLINGSAILAPDNKMIQHSNQLTLQQVVGGGGLVVSPIQLVASQGFKVIGQPNGVTTIELSGPNINGHPNTTLQHHQQQRSHHLTHTQPGNLQKLLMNGNGVTSTSSGNISTISIPTIAQHGTNGSRLAPGGAELNLLPSNTTPNGAVYRNQGKLAIMKDTNNSSRVHMMQSTPTIVVTQSQGINIITSSAQLSGKMMQTNAPQYLSATSVKPMLLVNHNGSGSPTSVANDVGKSQN